VIINFYNAWGLDRRKALTPKSVNYVYEVNYNKRLSSKQLSENADIWTVVGQEVFVLDEKGGILRRLHRYVHNKGINFKTCEKDTKIYLRFELKGEWYHIISTNEWY